MDRKYKVYWVFDPITGMEVFDSREDRDAMVAYYAAKGINLQHIGCNVVADGWYVQGEGDAE